MLTKSKGGMQYIREYVKKEEAKVQFLNIVFLPER